MISAGPFQPLRLCASVMGQQGGERQQRAGGARGRGRGDSICCALCSVRCRWENGFGAAHGEKEAERGPGPGL